MNARLHGMSAVLIGIFILALALPCQAKDLKITDVFVDYDAKEMDIWGEAFNKCGKHANSLKVTLARYLPPLKVSYYDPARNLITAQLPNGILPGDFLLTVSCASRGKRPWRNDEYDLTIPAEGKQGPKGEQGPPGPSIPPNFNTYTNIGLRSDGWSGTYVVVAQCASSASTVTGGGCTTTEPRAAVTDTVPLSFSWSCKYRCFSTTCSAATLTTYVICLE